MNYDALDKLIPGRRSPDVPRSPSKKLYVLLRTLDDLRVMRAKASLVDIEELDKQIRFYEQVLEQA